MIANNALLLLRLLLGCCHRRCSCPSLRRATGPARSPSCGPVGAESRSSCSHSSTCATSPPSTGRSTRRSCSLSSCAPEQQPASNASALCHSAPFSQALMQLLHVITSAWMCAEPESRRSRNARLQSSLSTHALMQVLYVTVSGRYYAAGMVCRRCRTVSRCEARA